MAWDELTDEKMRLDHHNENGKKHNYFDMYATSFLIYGCYGAPSGWPPSTNIAPKNIYTKAGRPGEPPLKKRYWHHVILKHPKPPRTGEKPLLNHSKCESIDS